MCVCVCVRVCICVCMFIFLYLSIIYVIYTLLSDTLSNKYIDHVVYIFYIVKYPRIIRLDNAFDNREDSVFEHLLTFFWIV